MERDPRNNGPFPYVILDPAPLKGDAQQAALLRLLLLRHLCGRRLLPGNPVLFPLLGQLLVLRVDATTTASTDSTASGDEQLPPRIEPHTEVELLLGTGESVGGEHALDPVHLRVAAAANAAAEVVGGALLGGRWSSGGAGGVFA